MQLIELAKVVELTGLSSHQVREWTVRRKLVIPEALPAGPGTRAKFSWKSVLLLKLLFELHREFGVELERARSVMKAGAEELDGRGFLGLWGRYFVVDGDGHCSFDLPKSDAGSFICISLDQHLAAITEAFSAAPPPRQLTLFPAVSVASS